MGTDGGATKIYGKPQQAHMGEGGKNIISAHYISKIILKWENAFQQER